MLLGYLPRNPLKWEDGRDRDTPDEYNPSSPKENIDQLSILSYDEDEKQLLKNDDLIITCNLQLEIARKNIDNKKPIVDRDDNRIITASKRALCEIYPTLKFMINQTVSKNNLDEMDRFDLEKVCKHLEELNNICNNIYVKP